MIEPVSAKASLRVLRFLEAVGRANISNFQDGSKTRLLLSGTDNAKMVCQLSQLDALHKASLISMDENTCALSSLGRKRIKRANAIAKGAVDGGFQAQHQTVERSQKRVDGVLQDVAVNTSESPLHRLKTRKSSNGSTWIDDAAYEAGERLRKDFSQGQLMQKVTANWDLGMGSTSNQSGAGGKADLSNSAIDARTRLESALNLVGPELAGVLTDVCCFLKGLECVERERRWPPRSAKLMLRTGLNLLARHYGTKTGGSKPGKTRKWNVPGYRPALSPDPG